MGSSASGGEAKKPTTPYRIVFFRILKTLCDLRGTSADQDIVLLKTLQLEPAVSGGNKLVLTSLPGPPLVVGSDCAKKYGSYADNWTWIVCALLLVLSEACESGQGENFWSNPQAITKRFAEHYLGRFQGAKGSRVHVASFDTWAMMHYVQVGCSYTQKEELHRSIAATRCYWKEMCWKHFGPDK